MRSQRRSSTKPSQANIAHASGSYRSAAGTVSSLQLANHRQARLDGPAICVLDGDTTDRQLAGLVEQPQALDSTESCLRLPGDSSPETWVLGALLADPYRDALAGLTRLEAGRLAAALEQLGSTPRSTTTSPANSPERHAIDEDRAVYMITLCVADHPGLQPIRDHVASLLNGP